MPHSSDLENSTELSCEARLKASLTDILDILDENEYRYHVLGHSGLVNDWFLAYVDLARAVNDYLELNITDTYEVPQNRYITVNKQMGYYHPAGGKGTQKELADMYGVEGTKFSRPGMGEQRTSNEVERDIRKAMMDDYSTREFLKYNEDVRDEANEIKGLRDQNAFINDAMKQSHKDAGNGGKYSSDADRGGVAQGAFETYEQGQQDAARAYTDKRFNKLKNKMNEEGGGSNENASSNMTYNEYLENADTQKATEGFSSAAKGQSDGSADQAAQSLLSDTVKRVAGDGAAMGKGKVNQGNYVLSNLKSDTYGGN